MGRIRTKDIKNLTFGLIEAYPERFNSDFEKNKDALNSLNLIKDKRVRNKVAGYLSRVRRRQILVQERPVDEGSETVSRLEHSEN